MKCHSSLALGRMIKRKRTAAGETQTVFAKRLGISRSFLSQLETGIRVVSLRKFAHIVHVLRVNPSRVLLAL